MGIKIRILIYLQVHRELSCVRLEVQEAAIKKKGNFLYRNSISL